MLQRMNELATQAANGTNSVKLTELPSRMRSIKLTTEIDRVAETTKFNETYLLKGDTTGTHTANFISPKYAIKVGATLFNEKGTQLDAASLKTTLAEGGKVYKDATQTALAAKGTDYEYVSKFYDAKGNEISADDAVAGGAEVYADKNKAFKISDDGTNLATNNYVKTATVNDDLIFNLHVGADSEANNKIAVKIEQMSAAGIGIEGLKVDTEDDATASVRTQLQMQSKKYLHSVQHLVLYRTDLSTQSTTLITFLRILQSAESRIRDTDMAEEMVNYSKNNILAQAGQSMLAQANQSNQGVLSLLQ